jgi:hypothetical protein
MDGANNVVLTEEATATSEGVAAIEPNGRCLDVVNGSNLKSATLKWKEGWDIGRCNSLRDTSDNSNTLASRFSARTA